MATRSNAMEAIYEKIAHLEEYMRHFVNGGTTLSTRVADAFNELSVQQDILKH